MVWDEQSFSPSEEERKVNIERSNLSGIERKSEIRIWQKPHFCFRYRTLFSLDMLFEYSTFFFCSLDLILVRWHSWREKKFSPEYALWSFFKLFLIVHAFVLNQWFGAQFIFRHFHTFENTTHYYYEFDFFPRTLPNSRKNLSYFRILVRAHRIVYCFFLQSSFGIIVWLCFAQQRQQRARER